MMMTGTTCQLVVAFCTYHDEYLFTIAFYLVFTERPLRILAENFLEKYYEVVKSRLLRSKKSSFLLRKRRE